MTPGPQTKRWRRMLLSPAAAKLCQGAIEKPLWGRGRRVAPVNPHAGPPNAPKSTRRPRVKKCMAWNGSGDDRALGERTRQREKREASPRRCRGAMVCPLLSSCVCAFMQSSQAPTQLIRSIHRSAPHLYPTTQEAPAATVVSVGAPAATDRRDNRRRPSLTPRHLAAVVGYSPAARRGQLATDKPLAACSQERVGAMAMNLAAFTLKPPTSVAAAVVGAFDLTVDSLGRRAQRSASHPIPSHPMRIRPHHPIPPPLRQTNKAGSRTRPTPRAGRRRWPRSAGGDTLKCRAWWASGPRGAAAAAARRRVSVWSRCCGRTPFRPCVASARSAPLAPARWVKWVGQWLYCP